MHLVYWRAPGRGLPRDPLGEFDDWLARYEAASVAERPGLTAEGERLVQRRQPAMALRRAVPRLVRLPESVAQHVEQHAEGLARYDVTVACGGAGHRFCKVERRLMLDGRVLTPRWHGRRAHLGSRENLPVHGIVLGDQMAVADEPARELSAREKTVLGHGESEVVMSLAGELRAFPSAAAAAAWQERLITAEQVPGTAVQRSVVGQASGSQRPGGTGRRYAVLQHVDAVVFAFRLAKRVISLRGEVN